MPLKQEENRNALRMLCLEEQISQESLVRIVDLYLEILNLNELGFEEKGLSHEGRPAYKCRVLLGLYLYGYMNKIRSSRELEKACKINIELWWLLSYEKPSYKTISDFRKDNKEGFTNLFIHFREFCKSLDLYGKKTVAIDGSKFRAQNSKKNNYNEKKINQHLDYISQQQKNYIAQLDTNDDQHSKAINKKIKSLDKRNQKYRALKDELEQIEETQISIIDSDSRSMIQHRNIVEVCYNIQSSVDDKHNLIANIEVTNEIDANALSSQCEQTRQALGLEQGEKLTVLADKGYHTAEQLAICQANDIETLVAPKKNSHPSKHPDFRKESFKYDQQAHQYICPANKRLTTKGNWLTKKDKKREIKYQYFSISSKQCNVCPLRENCLSKNQKSRSIDRNEFEYAVEKNKLEVSQRRDEYKRRQAIVEHPFGTIKRQWGYDYTLLKGIEKVKTEFSLIFLCYNIKRVIKILGVEKFKKQLKAAFSYLKYFLAMTTIYGTSVVKSKT